MGEIPTGDYSNADMAANYIGMKFYINVTEPVMLRGRRMAPMVVRDGDFFRLRPEVPPETGYFAQIVSDQHDEVLEPI